MRKKKTTVGLSASLREKRSHLLGELESLRRKKKLCFFFPSSEQQREGGGGRNLEKKGLFEKKICFQKSNVSALIITQLPTVLLCTYVGTVV